MLTSDMWGDILRFVVRAVPRQHNNEKEIQKDFGKVVDRYRQGMIRYQMSRKTKVFQNKKVFKKVVDKRKRS